MGRTITVKGIGKASAKPDYVVIGMDLSSQDMDYDKALALASENITHLTDAIVSCGFEKDAVKTTNFNVRTDYNSVKDKNGNYKREFNGYVISHSLKVEFDFDSKKLSQALSAIAGCLAHPELSIRFTVKDSSAVSEEMLRSATENARRKAEILCDASGMKLGELKAIDYNWGELDIYSSTRYEVEDRCLGAPMVMADAAIDFEPDDIEVGDTVTFVWEIKES